MNIGKMPSDYSTWGGALLSVVVMIDCGDLIKSFLLGVVGTMASYGASRLLKALFE